MRSPISALWALVPLLAGVSAQSSKPQPFDILPAGDAGISAQMMFLGSTKKVYIIDKAENNPLRINGQYGEHPAWAVEYDIETQQIRPMDVFSNAFCAGGAQLGNGTWAIFGGNQPVTTGGEATNNPNDVYKVMTGGTAIRMLNPCDDQSCEYIQGTQTIDVNQDTGGYLQMTSKRWYPSIETLGDGTIFVIGGDLNGGFINDQWQDNPTYEFFPPRDEGRINLQFLSDTLPLNLYPLVWLMPSGKLFMQANRKTILYDLNTRQTTDMEDMPFAARVYPASAATVMLPLTPRNNYQPEILFCGGSNVTDWGDAGGPKFNITAHRADETCVRIAPEGDGKYVTDDNMPEGRSMGEFILMPDGNIWMGNGVEYGVAGYGNQKFSTGVSYGQAPLYTPAMYHPENPSGQRWERNGMKPSVNERMYHSTAVLLPDSSILISGSNPNADFTNEQWRSRTDIDRWYPAFWNEPRPTFTGLPKSLSYGGDYFNLTLDTTDEAAINNTKVTILRSGFHTHALGMGQRLLELKSSYLIDHNTNKTTLFVSQLPSQNGPNLFQPGNALFFVVTNGVPSIGEMVMVGNGQLSNQPTAPDSQLPQSRVVAATQPSETQPGGASSTDDAQTPQGATDGKNGASSLAPGSILAALGLAVASLLM